ncbi:vegetative cell wall protein gp1-like [Schistocerca americana]|uniref:vegetative cell wall protein gp1-like n=1 Tax=Schistocerca americana TaxID=7009 RepID=UPI001F4FE165|nr:vegetative cell wall protein gp1-like [Schistocerca americana]
MSQPTTTIIFTSPSAAPTTITWSSSSTPLPILPSLPVHPTLKPLSAVTTPNSSSPITVAPSTATDFPPLPAPPPTGSKPARISTRRSTVSVTPTPPPSASSAAQAGPAPAISPCNPSPCPLTTQP